MTSRIPFWQEKIFHVPCSFFRGHGQCVHSKPGQHPAQPADRQAHHIIVVPGDALYKHTAVPLDAVSPSLVHGLSSGQVVVDIPLGQGAEADRGGLVLRGGPATGKEGDAGVYHMLPTGQSGEHSDRLLSAVGLAQHQPAHRYHRVSGDDQAVRVGGGDFRALLAGQLLHQPVRRQRRVHDLLPLLQE